MISSLKRKLLESIGIDIFNLPSSFNEKIISLNQVFSQSEQNFYNDRDACGVNYSRFCIKDVVGTDHDTYTGKTWFEAFLLLQETPDHDVIKKYFENPEYYELLKSPTASSDIGNTKIGLIEKGGKYFVSSHHGGGNNRIILLKILYLALQSKNINHSSDHDVDEDFTFYANIVRSARLQTTPEIISNLVYERWTEDNFVCNISLDPNFKLFKIITKSELKTDGEHLQRIPGASSMVYDNVTEEMLPMVLEEILIKGRK